MTVRPDFDIAVVGAGIVGLAVARELRQRHPGRSVVVLDREATVGAHQTGHNSGVIHSGVHYRPGSLKARLCVEGAARMYEYCDEHGIPYERCGKLIVALDDREVAGLDELERRGRANGRDGSLVDDFVISATPGAVHVRNAPSPAATSSLALAAELVRRIKAHAEWP